MPVRHRPYYFINEINEGPGMATDLRPLVFCQMELIV